jgi:hypothetical protein
VTRRSLPEKIVALHEALGEIPHAFGGAIALAYYAEPRATIDIDLNLFVPADRAGEIAVRLAAFGVTGSVELVERDGQARLAWDDTDSTRPRRREFARCRSPRRAFRFSGPFISWCAR